MSTIRVLLDCLDRHSLVKLLNGRGLASSRDNDDRRKALTYSYRGDVEQLINDLSRQQLVEIFDRLTFWVDEVHVFLADPAKHSHDDLRAFGIRAFTERRVRIAADFELVAEEHEADEDNPCEPANDDFEGFDDITGDEDGTEDDDGDEGSRERGIFGNVTPAWSRPQMVSRIITTLGWELPERLRTVRFRDLIEELNQHGIEACLATDHEHDVLNEQADSPGIVAKLRLRRRGEARGADSSEMAVELNAETKRNKASPRQAKLVPRGGKKVETPGQLRAAIEGLSPSHPMTDRFSTRWRALKKSTGVQQEQRGVWYKTQHQHWLGWLDHYDGPGAYDRENWDRTAAFVYNHIVNPQMLIYLAEATGVDRALVESAIEGALGKGSMAAMCAAIRRTLPWTMIERAVLAAS